MRPREIWRAALGVGLAAGAAGQAQALAIADVRTYWSAWVQAVARPGEGPISGFPSNLTDLFDVGCIGGAAGGDTGCSGSARLEATLSAPGMASAEGSGGFRITNTSSETLYFDVAGGYTAFNPGGPAIGIRVTDPLHEQARLVTRLSGERPQNADYFSGFDHTVSCATSVAEPGCGLSSPDSSDWYLGVLLQPGQSAVASYRASIRVDVTSIPEPSLGALIGVAGLGLAIAHRVRRPRQSRRD